MRRSLAFLLTLVLTGTYVQAQLVNDGATIKIQPGAIVFVSGNVENKNSGTISNDGKLEVQGNFLNAAVYTTATADDSLIMSGALNATLNPGASVLSHLYINKTANSNFVTLAGSTTIGTKLTYSSGTLSTDPIANIYTLNAAASVPFQFTAGREIIGRVRRTAWTNAVTTVFNQPNMQVTTNAGTAPTEFTVNMIPEVNGGDPTQIEREVKRKYVFTPVGGSAYTTDARFPYTASELNTNGEANLVPWNLPVTEWTGRLTPVTRDVANDWVATTGIPLADIATEWKLADPKYTFNMTVYLRGAWNNPTGLMRTTLNSSGLLPLSQPYTAAPHNYAGTESVAAIPNANIVDWVLVEMRKPSTGLPANATAATFIGRKAAFLLNNGTIVDLDGVTPLTIDINKQGAGFFVIRHRNHLAVMSNSLPSNTTGTYANNFSALANNYFKPGNPSAAAMLLFPSAAPGNTMYGMWVGDVNRSNAVTSADISQINAAIAGPAAGNTNVYSLRDVTLDRNVTSTDVSQTNLALSSSAQTSSSKVENGIVTGVVKEKVVKSHVPGESE